MRSKTELLANKLIMIWNADLDQNLDAPPPATLDGRQHRTVSDVFSDTFEVDELKRPRHESDDEDDEKRSLSPLQHGPLVVVNTPQTQSPVHLSESPPINIMTPNHTNITNTNNNNNDNNNTPSTPSFPAQPPNTPYTPYLDINDTRTEEERKRDYILSSGKKERKRRGFSRFNNNLNLDNNNFYSNNNNGNGNGNGNFSSRLDQADAIIMDIMTQPNANRGSIGSVDDVRQRDFSLL